MEETVNLNKLYKELLILKKEIEYIKNNMVDVDTIMTIEDEKKLEETMEAHKKGKTKSLETLKKELGG